MYIDRKKVCKTISALLNLHLDQSSSMDRHLKQYI